MNPNPSNNLQKESVMRFFQNVESRAWTDAEKELDNIRQKSENIPWNKGYVKALEGLLLTFRNNDDKYIFLSKLLANPTLENLQTLKNEFAEFASNDLHGEYDRGYFKALEEYLESFTAQKRIKSKDHESERQVEQGKVTSPVTANTANESVVKEPVPLE
jgi:hypothetical protein